MKTKLTKFIAIALTAFLAISFATPSYAVADACESLEPDSIAWESAGCGDNANAFPEIIKNIISAVIGVLGLVAVIYIIKGGVTYMTSSGDAAKLQAAKNTILYALIGLLVCVLSYAIVNFTFNTALKEDSNTSVTKPSSNS